MLDSRVFNTSREVARDKLSAEEAKNSFGYYIDIPSCWETSQYPAQMINVLGIHKTHAEHFLEIIEDLGPLSQYDIDWARRYVDFYNHIIRQTNTTDKKVDFKHDLAETLFDWRTILKFKELPAKILDFGAGCCRQGLSAYLRNKDNIYVAVDASLSAYTIQNLVLSNFENLGAKGVFSEFLDFEVQGAPFPKIREAVSGDRFHVPTWFLEDNVPEKYFDIIIASHVHNELSGPDFLRLMRAVKKGLGEEGVFYVRSELTAVNPLGYFDLIDFHGLDIIGILREEDIYPVYCKVESKYQTTVFARKGSSHYKKALTSKDPAYSFLDVKTGSEASRLAGEYFVIDNMRQMKTANKKVVFVGEGNHFFNHFLLNSNRYLEPKSIGAHISNLLGATKEKGLRKAGFKRNRICNHQLIYKDEQILKGNQKICKEILAFNPDYVVVASHKLFEIEAEIKKMLPHKKFFRKHYYFPVSFSYAESINGAAEELDHPIFV